MELKYPEIWGGIECTLNRVGDSYFDQLKYNGHYDRVEDLDLIASLGIKKLRYPILWEKISPKDIKDADWTWADERLNKIKSLGITPIVGFVHHGCGPIHTSLVNDCFAPKLAEFAKAFAERYPWVKYYTPINEPLTTARFSGLYGHWYPHKKDEYTFVQALFNQCKAVIESMRAIRKINPDAKLVQTEDLGKVYSTETMVYQAKFENDRRWLSFDLLTARLTPQRRLWYYMTYLGVKEEQMQWFLDNPCPPDIIGINHYLTSERFLDENIEIYPGTAVGKNEFNTYADVEALRVCKEGASGHYHLLKDTWERYHIPLALTEVHLFCKREEQLRWFKQAWDLSVLLLNEGVDIKGVTAWALLGSFDWCNLVTKEEGHYETGVFDIRSGKPRATALASMIKGYSENKSFDHPVLKIPGWWKRPTRLLYPPISIENQNANVEPQDQDLKKIYKLYFTDLTSDEIKELMLSSRPLLIVGAGGTLGSAFKIICKERAIPYKALTRNELDITDKKAVEKALSDLNPWAVINASGYVRVDEAENEKDACFHINVSGAAFLAEVCQAFDIQYVSFSSDLVFDGRKKKPYLESDPVFPLNAYGKSKANAEKEVLKLNSKALMIRTSSFFGPWDKYNWIIMALEKVSSGATVVMSNDQIFTATYVPDLVHATLDLLIDKESGIWHITNPGEVTWVSIAKQAAEYVGLESEMIIGRKGVSKIKKPSYSVLGTEKGIVLPKLESALKHFCDMVRKREMIE